MPDAEIPPLFPLEGGGAPIAGVGAVPAQAPPIGPERIFRGGQPIGGEASTFFSAGTPIRRLDLLIWSGGLPIGPPGSLEP